MIRFFKALHPSQIFLLVISVIVFFLLMVLTQNIFEAAVASALYAYFAIT